MDDFFVPYKVLEDKIREIAAGRQILYVANPGNYGDGLIRLGTTKFMENCGFSFKELFIGQSKNRFEPYKFDFLNKVSHSYFQKRVLVLYGGGGAWCIDWPDASLHVSMLSAKFGDVLVLPSTYQIGEFPETVTYFRRDEFDSKSCNPNSLFCHDMAFYIDRSSEIKGNGTGFFLCTDKESNREITPPYENIDISSLGNHLSDMSEFISKIEERSVIITDRLHVAISGCLLRKQVFLFPGNYFKNKAVYNSSMKNYFPNVTFVEDKGDRQSVISQYIS